MIISIIGRPDSGKSKIAEDIALELSKKGERIYLATMRCVGEEGKERIKKHRKSRFGKGFITIEQPYGLCDILPLINHPEEATVLLECISNLVANLMFEQGLFDENLLLSEIKKEIEGLSLAVKNTVLVSNVFEPVGDEKTDAYIAACERVNFFLEQISDETRFI